MNGVLRATLLAAAISVAPSAAFCGGIDCKVGPVEKTYGASKWFVYSCGDGLSLVFVSAPGSAAFPFYFFRLNGRLHGEGTGNKKATDAAFADISKLDDDDAAALVRSTQTVGLKN
jgi:hypothetical protein